MRRPSFMTLHNGSSQMSLCCQGVVLKFVVMVRFHIFHQVGIQKHVPEFRSALECYAKTSKHENVHTTEKTVRRTLTLDAHSLTPALQHSTGSIYKKHTDAPQHTNIHQVTKHMLTGRLHQLCSTAQCTCRPSKLG